MLTDQIQSSIVAKYAKLLQPQQPKFKPEEGPTFFNPVKAEKDKEAAAESLKLQRGCFMKLRKEAIPHYSAR